MTDSNINNLLDNNKEEENTNKQPVDTNFDSQILNSSFTNVFKETNYTPTFNFDDYVNETFFDEETFDFAGQDFSITNNIFNDLTEEKPQKDLEVTDNLLKYIGVSEYITKGDVSRKPKTRIKVENTKDLPTDEQVMIWKEKYGCEAQKGSIYLHQGNNKGNVVFPEDSGIRPDNINDFIFGSPDGYMPLIEKIDFE